MDINIQKEEFSYAYINSIVSTAGLSQIIQTRSMDMKSVDITISKPDKPYPVIDVQVKCTSSSDIIDINKNSILYDLPVNNYNQLIDKDRRTPLIFILVLVPEDVHDWVVVDKAKSETLVKKCAYWMSLKGYSETNNNTKQRIKIPLTNLLTPDSLNLIMDKVGKRQEI